MRCPDCEFTAKSPQGLGAHRRWKHRETSSGDIGANRQAVEETLQALSELGRLEDVDAARVQMLRSMADALDLNPFNSQMWHEFGEAIEGLTADGSDDDDEIQKLLDAMSSPVSDSDQKKT